MAQSITPAVLRGRQIYEYIGVSRAKLYLLMSEGKIRTFKVGGCRAARRVTLDEDIERLEAESFAEAGRGEA